MKQQRLKAPFGTLVNTNNAIEFTFEGRSYTGYEGDTIASALWANGQKMISRSFKYHRPRGILSMTGQDANTFVQLKGESNVPADTYKLSRHLEVKGQHYIGSLEKDRMAFAGKLSRFLPVGFYYKAFYRFNLWEKWWHRIFRKLTGLGTINPENIGSAYDKQYLFYDIVVIGAGLSGMQSAIEATNGGAKVLLVDENVMLGGSLNYSRMDAEGTAAQKLKTNLIAQVTNNKNITVMLDTVCNAFYADNWLAIIKDLRLYKTRAKQIIVAAGTFEQPLVFHNNDLPGIMLGTAAQRLMWNYGIKPGTRAVITTTNNRGYEVVLDLLDAGVEVAAVVDLRTNVSTDSIVQAVIEKKVEVLQNHTVFSANSSENVLVGVEIRAITGSGQCSTEHQYIDCDLLCMSGGHMPAYQLPCHVGAHLNYNENTNQFIIENLSKAIHLTGSMNGANCIEGKIEQAKIAAFHALSDLGMASGKLAKIKHSTPISNDFVLPIFNHDDGKEFIDYDEDLQIADIINAVREGYEDIQLVKRFSTLGMGPSQGRYAAFMSALLVASLEENRSIGKVGVTTARPPFAAEKLGHMAGRSFFPERHSNMHYRHVEINAQPLIAGAWIRPAYYGPKGTLQECVNKECLNVHNNVGVVDVSTLGGLEIRGPDAAEFINRVYTWNFIKQPVGKARYALLTNEAGVVIDDGVACRFSDQHFYVTATTGGVDNVYLQFLRWNVRWRLDVDIANVTSAWCGVNIAGPNSRKVLEKICTDVDLSSQAFPYVGVREGTIADMPARIIRVGFVGELGYEIHVPQHYGEALWDAVIEAGKEFDIMPFGIEAQRVLRLEKGHVIISQDTDSMTYPEEINMSWAVSDTKPFFVGKRSIDIVRDNKLIRKLIGFEIPDEKGIKPQENHLLFDQNNKLIGRVTSCAYSAFLNKTIGLAYIDPTFSEVGQAFKIRCDGKQNAQAKVVSLPFYDPNNQRQKI